MSHPSTVNISIVISDTFSQQYQLSTCSVSTPSIKPTSVLTGATTLGNATYTPIDLTGATITSQIRRTIGSVETLLASITVNIDNAVNGLFTLSMTPTNTSLLKINENASDTYYVQVTDSNLVVTTYIVGSVTLIGL
jgi:hypothetical protein